VISAALELSPRSSPSTPPAASAITFFAAAQAGGDLRGEVRTGEDCDAAAAHGGREPLAGRRVEALREAQHRRVSGEPGRDLGKRIARHRDDDRVDVARGVVDGDHRPDAAQVDALEEARIVSRLGDRPRLLRGVAGEDDVVPAVEQHPRERGAP
jgi:hypothetical protein